MENFALAANEVLLYKGTAAEADAPEDVFELRLTNLQLVFIRKGGVNVAAFPVSDIKIYREVPQIRQKKRSVELFLVGGEKLLLFKNSLDAARFTDAAFELLTGKTKIARGAGKVKKTIDDVNEALGVNILEEVRSIGIDTISGIVSKAIPTGLRLLAGKKKKKNKK